MWNEVPQAIRNLSKNVLNRKLKQILINILSSQDSYIDLSQIIKFSTSDNVILAF